MEQTNTLNYEVLLEEWLYWYLLSKPRDVSIYKTMNMKRSVKRSVELSLVDSGD